VVIELLLSVREWCCPQDDRPPCAVRASGAVTKRAKRPYRLARLPGVNDPADRPQHLDLRASDADRERVAKLLHNAMGEGRLSIDELDERLQSVDQA
jgi:hypothetical protein